MDRIENYAIVYLNSSNRYLPSAECQFVIPVDGWNLSFSSFNYVLLKSCSIPKSYYGLRASQATFQLQEGMTIVDVVLEEGTYSRVNLKGQLITQLNAASPNGWTYTCDIPNTSVQHPETGKYTFSVSGNTSQPSFIFPDKDNPAQSLGFARNSVNTFVGNSLVSTNVINLQPSTVLMLRSKMINPVKSPGFVLDQINVSVASNFSTIVKENIGLSAAKEIQPNELSNSIHIALTSEDPADVIDSLGGLPMIFELMFFSFKKIVNPTPQFSLPQILQLLEFLDNHEQQQKNDEQKQITST